MGKAELEASLSTLDIWLIVFGVLVAIGVAGESVTGFLHWRRSGQLSVMQAADNLSQQTEIARLSAEAEMAKSEIAKANARTAEADVRLELLRKEVGPRFIDREKFLAILGDDPKSTALIIYGAEDQDSWMLSMQLRALLETAGWTVLDVVSLPVLEILKNVIVIPMNVKVEVNSISQEETKSSLELVVGRPATLRTPYSVMMAALMRGLERGAVGGVDSSLPNGVLHLTIAPR